MTRIAVASFLAAGLFAGSSFAADIAFAETAATNTPYSITVPLDQPQPGFIPKKVYDDGHFTYIELGQKPERFEKWPAVFELASDGARTLRNFIIIPDKNQYRIDGVIQRGELRFGTQVVFFAHP